MSSLTIVIMVAAALLFLSVLASKASSRFGVPSLLVFLAIGMAAGSDAIGIIRFYDVELTQTIGIFALAFILFSGGLDTSWPRVRPILTAGASLATVGVFCAAAIVGVVTHLFLGVPLLTALLLGAVVSSTDAAAVFAVLRSRGVNLRGDLQPVIELESGSNDPMSVFLTLALIDRIMNPLAPLSHFAFDFALQMVVGALIGVAAGRLATWVLNQIDLEFDGLYPVLSLAVVLATYGVSDALGGNGFLSTYIAGVVLGNSRFVHRRSVLRFNDGIAWLMQIAMFLALGLLVIPWQLPAVAKLGMTIAIVGTLIARPVATFVALAASRFDWREKLFIAWAGLRGAVPIILATFAMTAKLPGGTAIFNVVFFTVLVSVLVQGATIPAAAKVLRVDAPPTEPESAAVRLESDLITLDVHPHSPAAGRKLLELALPDDTLVLLVYRGNTFFPASGGTLLKAGDVLVVFTSRQSMDGVKRTLSG